MKQLLIAIYLTAMVACGGGNNTTEHVDSIDPPVSTRAILYSYTVTSDTDTRSYAGTGISVNDVIYMAPVNLSDSGFSVVGEISGDEVRLFDYITRELVVAFINGDNSGYHLELETLSEIDNMSLSNIPDQWFNSSSAGMFGDPIIILSNTEGVLTGSDTSGCNINGEIFEIDNVIGIELTLLDCAHAGDYSGALRVEGDRIIGAATSAEHGFMLSYNF